MTYILSIPWQRYALICELAKRLDGVSPQFGKTALQKLVFMLQAVYGIDCGYEFDLYSYGPFTSQLLNDLDLVKHFGCVYVEPVLSPTGGYNIRPAEGVDSVRDKASAFFDDPRTSSALDELVSTYGRLSAKELELRATIVYVERERRRKHTPLTKAECAASLARSSRSSPASRLSKQWTS